MTFLNASVVNPAIPTCRVYLAAWTVNEIFVFEICDQVDVVRVQQPSAANLSQCNYMWII